MNEQIDWEEVTRVVNQYARYYYGGKKGSTQQDIEDLASETLIAILESPKILQKLEEKSVANNYIKEIVKGVAFKRFAKEKIQCVSSTYCDSTYKRRYRCLGKIKQLSEKYNIPIEPENAHKFYCLEPTIGTIWQVEQTILSVAPQNVSYDDMKKEKDKKWYSDDEDNL